MTNEKEQKQVTCEFCNGTGECFEYDYCGRVEMQCHICRGNGTATIARQKECGYFKPKPRKKKSPEEKRIAELEKLNQELLEALKITVPYMHKSSGAKYCTKGKLDYALIRNILQRHANLKKEYE